MRRSIESDIEQWATEDASRPLLIRGARRVGKTYVAEEMGKRIAGDAFVKLDFQTDLNLIAPIFEGPTDNVDAIMGRIADYKRVTIRKENAFILFDEVQLANERSTPSASFRVRDGASAQPAASLVSPRANATCPSRAEFVKKPCIPCRLKNFSGRKTKDRWQMPSEHILSHLNPMSHIKQPSISSAAIKL